MTTMHRNTSTLRLATLAALALLAGFCAPRLLAEEVLVPLPEGATLVRQDPDGHGLLLKMQKKRVLLVGGSPGTMGRAQGRLVGDLARDLVKTRMYFVGAGYSLARGDWFWERMAEVVERSRPHTPERFLRELAALGEAAGLSERDIYYANFFPEMFHCTGVAVRGKASKDGRVVHARVLDYMRDIGLQKLACVQVYVPAEHHAWVSHGYGGFIGTVTAMNEKGLAIGQMGGRGEGDWDGCPLGFLMREVMERCTTVREALARMESTPRTCEYYYVLSDRTGDIAGAYATPGVFEILEPGAQHEKLPYVPEDTVFVSGPGRAEALSRRLQEHYGKIDAETMIEIIKRPVAMKSNLHDAVFLPETFEMYVSDAGRHSLACNEPYARIDLAELVRFYRAWRAARNELDASPAQANTAP